MLARIVANRSTVRSGRRYLSDAGARDAPYKRAIRRVVSLEERESLRQARRERAAKTLSEQTGAGAAARPASGGAGLLAPQYSRYIWYLGVSVPVGLLVWGFNDENSPPAKFSDMIGLTSLISSFSDEYARPSHDKLIPDWSQMPNVPHDIPIPPTLVLDLENTLVSSTWDRKYGWRHAKRPGVDKFLHDMAQYYEIVLYSPSVDGIADPVVTSLDKDGCIMHRLYRDATYYRNGVHVKDLNRLNRNVKKMVVLDDDPAESSLNPENLIRVKPYTDPTDRTDSTLARIAPFLIELVREGYDDFPAILQQYQGMDADEIADEQENRISQFKQDRQRLAQRGLGGLVRGGMMDNLPAPELQPTEDYGAYGSRSQLTAKDLVGAAPQSAGDEDGFMGWINRRNQEKEEQRMRKYEKWNEVMLRKQQKKEAERAQQNA